MMKTHPINHPSVARLFARLNLKPSTRNYARAMRDPIGRKRLNSSTMEGGQLITYRTKNSLPQLSQSERDLRRARKDKAFYKLLLAKIKPVKARSIKALDTYCATYSERQKVAEICAKISPIKALRYPVNAHQLPCDVETAEFLGAKVIKRGKDWEVQGSFSTRFSHTPGQTTWRNGRAVSYSRAENVTYVRAVGLILSPSLLVISLHGQKDAKHTAPEGCTWKIDNNGIALVRGRDDYHLETSDFLAQNPIAQILVKLETNAEKRREMECRDAAEKASAEGVFVCLADSIRAGNCRAGSLSFAQRHNLSIVKHYPALELLAQANGDSGRVKLAITAAKIRHRKEIERGYAVLAEHVA